MIHCVGDLVMSRSVDVPRLGQITKVIESNATTSYEIFWFIHGRKDPSDGYSDLEIRQFKESFRRYIEYRRVGYEE